MGDTRGQKSMLSKKIAHPLPDCRTIDRSFVFGHDGAITRIARTGDGEYDNCDHVGV